MRLFAFRGFDETTIEAITEAAGVSRSDGRCGRRR
jgi:AcrR family transcriptional regulator